MNETEIKHTPLTDLYLRYMENKTTETESAFWTGTIRQLRRTREYLSTGDGELLSNTVLKVWRSLHLFDPKRGPMESWLSIVIRNIQRDMLSSKHMKYEVLDEDIDSLLPSDVSGYPPEAASYERFFGPKYAPTEEQWAMIKSLVDCCLISRLLASRRLAVAAEECGISEKTARNRLSLLKKFFRKRSGRIGFERRYPDRRGKREKSLGLS